jgi:hypothetical protein
LDDFEKIAEFLKKLEPFLLIVVPAIIALWIKIKKRVSERNEVEKKKNNDRAWELFKIWEQEESRKTISRIRELCNVYKDTSKADQVLFFHIENGTVSPSSLHSMFVSCLAEDNRYGSKLPKKCASLQRIPFNILTDWVKDQEDDVLLVPDITAKYPAGLGKPEFFSGVKSHISCSLCNDDRITTGFVVFNYSHINYDDLDGTAQRNILYNFKVAVKTVFLDYQISTRDKKSELKI